ncbi:MAG: SDR family oxidoreductase [Deltaproteobacteria bacterium]|nr:SDR family oxidoreductase [Deltaproteobacteria bacterium]
MKRSTAVVTGAGSGIGRETALWLARKGVQVFAVGRKPAMLNGTASLDTTHSFIFPLCADVTLEEELEAAFTPLKKVDIVVVNAGICETAAINASKAATVWQRVIHTNLTGSWNTLHTLADKLTDGARVVLVSSGLGKLGRAHYTAYSASKHGMLGVMKSLALEWAPKQIRVNAVCPGWVETEMAMADLRRAAKRNKTSIDIEGIRATERIPIGRFVQAKEVANLIGWLCSDESSGITGQAYNISGGEFGL